MIDEGFTHRMYGYTSDELTPKSHKLIIAVCDNCGKYRGIEKAAYRNLCVSCVRSSKYLSEETKRKKSIATASRNLGKSHSEETKRKLSESAKNRKPISKKTRDKMSMAHVGRVYKPISKETRDKISKAHKGMKASNETKRKMTIVRTGKKASEVVRRNMSAAQQGITINEWEGYANEKVYCDRFNDECRQRNRNKYDNKCFVCGKTKIDNGDRLLSVHHISKNKDEGCDGSRWGLIPLCGSCHGKAHNEPLQSRIDFLVNNV